VLHPPPVRQIARAAVQVSWIAALVVTAGCAGAAPSHPINASTELAALRAAGFSVHQVAPHALATSGHLPFVSLLAVWYASAREASHHYQLGYSPAALRQQFAEARSNPLYKGVLPRGVRVSMLKTKRVCNIILASFSPRPNPSLHARFERAVRALARDCN
jgi:hypothetical protein